MDGAHQAATYFSNENLSTPISLDDYGICSFSKSFKNVLLWSHYSDNHKGVCLAFDLNNDKIVFADKYLEKYDLIYNDNYDGFTLGEVEYSADLPNVDSDSEENALKIFFTKSKLWEYENEIRAILFKGYGKYVFPKSWLTKIYFGLQIDENERKNIIDLFVNFKYEVEFYQMKLMEKEFGIFEEKINLLG